MKETRNRAHPVGLQHGFHPLNSLLWPLSTPEGVHVPTRMHVHAFLPHIANTGIQNLQKYCTVRELTAPGMLASAWPRPLQGPVGRPNELEMAFLPIVQSEGKDDNACYERRVKKSTRPSKNIYTFSFHVIIFAILTSAGGALGSCGSISG